MRLELLARATSSTISQGDAAIEITSVAGLDLAGPGDVTFLANPKYTPQVGETRAAAIFLSEGVEIGRGDIAVLRARTPMSRTRWLCGCFSPPDRPSPAYIRQRS